MKDHEELDRWDREIVWHAFTQMAEYQPLLIERAHGATLVDVDGREYLDGTASLWCNVHGHRHPRIDAAVREQLDRVAHTTSLGASNPTTVRLARRLVDLAADGLNHVFFSDDGATAVEVALKMAFQYWRQCGRPHPEKTAFAALGDAYHGDTLGAVSVGGVERFHAMFEPLLFDVVRLPSPRLYRRPPGVTAEKACSHYLAQAERVLAAHHKRLAALVVEPLVQCAAGMIVHPPGYLGGLADLVRRYDVLLIVDEVATGFGRTGTMFACEREGVAADFLCLGKGLTGGYMPMAATLTTSEVWNAFLGEHAQGRQFFHGHTYGGNPLAAAAAIASLDVFEEEETLQKLRPKITRLGEHLKRIAAHPHVGDARQCGLAAGIELVRDRATAEPYPSAERRAQRVCDAARKKGVLLRPLGEVVPIMPPLSVKLDELDRIMAAVEHGIAVACT
ncbi:MAG TPA: adenosylmethionine--8-amino-7-oxononanoate transaminase [Pirellulales bacterium]|jgi:adenosylmethionine-8-amino-7-oxononanoate aminotransferase|nr:adenosylmethionine--8-amino-7-oxononanoate transaminase [Pirellulales bacterium]